MRNLLIFIIIIGWTNCYSQNSKFKGQIVVNDSLIVSDGSIVFPLSGDTLMIDSSGIATVDLSIESNRIFYFIRDFCKSKIFRFNSTYTSDCIEIIKIPDLNYYKQFEESRICPLCDSNKDVIPIRYGLVRINEQIRKEIKEGRYLLGGCIIYDPSANYRCKKDNFNF